MDHPSEAEAADRSTGPAVSAEKTARSTPAKGSARGTLTRERIIGTAIEIIDREGLGSLTMRRLGTALAVEPMSLYWHVNGREDLLEAVVDALVDSIRIPEPRHLEPADGWQAFLQWLAHDVRRLALDHPAAFPLIATRHPAAPWLRPPLRSLRVVEGFLEGLKARGFTDDQAVAAYRSFTSFLLGHLLLEAAMRGVQLSPAEEPLDEGDADLPNRDEDLNVSDFPTVAHLRGTLSEDHTDAEFEAALEHLLIRLDLELAQ